MHRSLRNSKNNGISSHWWGLENGESFFGLCYFFCGPHLQFLFFFEDTLFFPGLTGMVGLALCIRADFFSRSYN